MGVAKWPLRKPLAIFAAGLVGLSIIWSLWAGKDLPMNLKDLLQWFGGLVLAAYYGTSTVEAVKGVGTKACPEKDG
nr:hypothetical protein [uncultured Dethiosulfovibrio sp.]